MTNPVGLSPACRRLQVGGSVLIPMGLLLVVVGTFAPWVTSGGVDRDSYAIAGIVGRLGLAGDGFGKTALSGWPFVGPIAVAALIAAIARWWRTCAGIAIAFGVLTGLIGGGVMAVAGGHDAVGIRLAHTGPVMAVIGAVLSIIGGSVILVAGRRALLGRQARRRAFLPVTTEPYGGPSRRNGQRVPDRPHGMPDAARNRCSEVHTAVKGTSAR